MPATLRGTLFRNGPGRFERGEQKYEHMLDGDGYVQSFSFGDDGSVFFRSKYVHTKYAAILDLCLKGTLLYRPGLALCHTLEWISLCLC